MDIYSIDFETYFCSKTYSLSDLGSWAYVNDPRFDCYLISVYGKDGYSFVGHPTEFTEWHRFKGATLLAHNMSFDGLVRRKLVDTGIIPKDCEPAQEFCTADLAVWLSAPRPLQKAAQALLGRSISKEYRGVTDGKSRKDWDDIEWDLICKSGVDDAKACYEIFIKFQDRWPEHERTISRINREMGWNGFKLNRKALDESIKHIEAILWQAGKDIPWDWGGTRSKTPQLTLEIATQCEKENIPMISSFAKDSTEFTAWRDLYAEKHPWIKALDIWRVAHPLLGKLKVLQRRMDDDDIYHFQCKYFGAHTGRFSGDQGFNMQAIYSTERFGIDVRSFFIPRSGHKLLVADYSQIEARIALWKSGHHEVLKKIAEEGLSVYEAHAVATMGYQCNPIPMKERSEAEVKQLYKLAKARVLGLQFGCGWQRFIDLAWKLCGLTLSNHEAQATVYDFRDKLPGIPRRWNTLMNFFQRAALSHMEEASIELESGRPLTYFNPKFDGNNDLRAQTERGGTWFKFFGGKFFENEVQALGRDIFAFKFEDLINAGYAYRLHVHDENVLEVPASADQKYLDEVDQIMTASFPWSEGLPLGIAMELCDSYTKP